MSCSFEEDLVAFRDGELPVARARALSAHLPGCESCTSLQARLERLSGAVSALSHAPAPVPSPALRAHVLSEFAQPPGGPLRAVGEWIGKGLRPWLLVPALAGLGGLAWLGGPVAARVEAPLPGWAAEVAEEPAQLEAALVLDELDELELGTLETAEDLEVVAALEELEQEGGRP